MASGETRAAPSLGYVLRHARIKPASPARVSERRARASTLPHEISVTPGSGGELLPTRRVMPEPPPQRIAWRNFLEPAGEDQRVLLHAARPKPVHQVAFPVFWHSGLVSALDLNYLPVHWRALSFRPSANSRIASA